MGRLRIATKTYLIVGLGSAFGLAVIFFLLNQLSRVSQTYETVLPRFAAVERERRRP